QQALLAHRVVELFLQGQHVATLSYPRNRIGSSAAGVATAALAARPGRAGRLSGASVAPCRNSLKDAARLRSRQLPFLEQRARQAKQGILVLGEDALRRGDGLTPEPRGGMPCLAYQCIQEFAPAAFVAAGCAPRVAGGASRRAELCEWPARGHDQLG